MQSLQNQNIYILGVYTNCIHMEDIFNNPILCKNCNVQTRDETIYKNGFNIRAKRCSQCNKLIYHPLDIQEYKNFDKLKSKQFQVKLRFVGNSYTVSIPKEIIDFQEEFDREMNKLINMCLEEPTKLSLFFSRKIRRF